MLPIELAKLVLNYLYLQHNINILLALDSLFFSKTYSYQQVMLLVLI